LPSKSATVSSGWAMRLEDRPGGSRRREERRVSQPWARSFEALGRQSRDVLRMMLHLRVASVSATGVQALRGPSPDDPNAVLNELAGSGWLVETGGHAWTMPESARSWLAGRVDPIEPRAALDRLSAYLVHELAARRGEVDAVQGGEIVAALRALASSRPAESVALAREVWRTLSTVPSSQEWWQDLADVGEDAAIAARRPAELIELLRDSGTALANAGEGFRADRQWRRAYALTEQVGDRERSAELLLLVGHLRRAKRAFGRALTVFHELVSLRQETGDEPGLAEALTELAVTLVEAGRETEARHFLDRAGSVMTSGESGRHTAALISLGRAWERAGSPAKATVFYGRALAALIDVDDDAAAEVRTLLLAATARRDAQ
jgi:tetratricopeptide (TPR) repeat protein